MFWRQIPFVPLRGAGSSLLQSWGSRQGPCRPWDGLRGGRAGASSLLVLLPAEVTSAPTRMKCSSAGTQATPSCGFGRKGFCFQHLFLEGISSTDSQDLFQRKETKPAGRKTQTHLLSLRRNYSRRCFSVRHVASSLAPSLPPATSGTGCEPGFVHVDLQVPSLFSGWESPVSHLARSVCCV